MDAHFGTVAEDRPFGAPALNSRSPGTSPPAPAVSGQLSLALKMAQFDTAGT